MTARKSTNDTYIKTPAIMALTLLLLCHNVVIKPAICCHPPTANNAANPLSITKFSALLGGFTVCFIVWNTFMATNVLYLFLITKFFNTFVKIITVIKQNKMTTKQKEKVLKRQSELITEILEHHDINSYVIQQNKELSLSLHKRDKVILSNRVLFRLFEFCGMLPAEVDHFYRKLYGAYRGQ